MRARLRPVTRLMPRWRLRTFSKAVSRASDKLTTRPRPEAEVAPLAVDGEPLHPGAGVSGHVEVESVASVGVAPGAHRFQCRRFQCHACILLCRVLYHRSGTLPDIGGPYKSLADGRNRRRIRALDGNRLRNQRLGYRLPAFPAKAGIHAALTGHECGVSPRSTGVHEWRAILRRCRTCPPATRPASRPPARSPPSPWPPPDCGCHRRCG